MRKQSYIEQLWGDVERAKSKLEAAYKIMQANPTMQNISLCNNASANLATAKSRLENHGKNKDFIDTWNIDNMYGRFLHPLHKKQT
jgi:hypothetical protein